MTMTFTYYCVAFCTLYLVRNIAADSEVAEFDVRLNGNTEYSGRVEVYFGDQWGTVCDDDWDDRDARVVCSQLGFTEGHQFAIGGAYYGEGNGTIVLDNVNCQGSEKYIKYCSRRDGHNCHHNEDAGVICNQPFVFPVRLNGPTEQQGRVEVFNGVQWGTVCDDDWDNRDARVVCRQLGFTSGYHYAVGGSYFGQGNGPIILSEVNCTGSERDIQNCLHNGLGIHCKHYEDAGVICNATDFVFPVRLNGSTKQQGRVEVFDGVQWGTVCDDRWDNRDARVVCHQLGFTTGYHYAVGGAYFGQGNDPIVLSDVGCAGSESDIQNCPNTGWGNDCGHSEDAGVICNTTGSVFPVRLNGNSRSAHQGRVEVFVGNQWGTVCDNRWDDSDARVVCRQLGFIDGFAEGGAYFGEGTGPIVLTDVICTGSESHIQQCEHFGWGTMCAHGDDAGVICNGTAVAPTSESSTTFQLSTVAPTNKTPTSIAVTPTNFLTTPQLSTDTPTTVAPTTKAPTSIVSVPLVTVFIGIGGFVAGLVIASATIFCIFKTWKRRQKSTYNQDATLYRMEPFIPGGN